MRISLVKSVPGPIAVGRIFDDAVLPFYYALRRLGHEVEIINNRFDENSRNIVFGANIDPTVAWLHDAPRFTIVNLEQFRLEGGEWAANQPYLELLKKNEVWDYSPSNADFLEKEHGLEVGRFIFGYVPEMTRLRDNREESIDVLFYGGINPRREKVLADLVDAGVRLKCLDHVYGAERDQAIYDSKIILNVHKGRTAILEMARLGYPLANRKAVVSELNEDTERYPGLEKACAFYPYEKLAAGVLELLADETGRRAQAEAGFESFSKISLVDSLERLVGRSDSGPRPDVAAGRETGRTSSDPGPDIYIGVADEWLAPEDGLPPSPPREGTPQSAWSRRLFLCLKHIKRWRYRRIVRRASGFKKYRYADKLERLEK